MTTAFIAQPTYLPWIGFFAAIDQADVCVLLDTVSLSRQSWQTRNRVRLPNGAVTWLSVPVQYQSGQALKDVRTANDRAWRRKHWLTVQAAYGRSPGYQTVQWLADVYEQPWPFLADLNAYLINALCAQLGITTPIRRASELGNTRAGRIERLIDIARLVDADTLIEPIGGQYLKGVDLDGVTVQWFDYQPVPYSQGGLEWQSHLSVVDLLAHHGSEAVSHIRSRS